jgi:light-regulated signal transduction histidine kinase (bacteriophytochrome)
MAFMPEPVFATDCLSGYLPEAVSFKALCAGLLALRFSDTKDDFLLWFRPEIVQTVNWAGDPHKPVDLSSDGQRLLPRSSFALWKETVRLKSSPWAEVELEAAKELRAALLEVVLRRAEQLGRLYADLERSHAELDSFAYIASHDLREPLRGITNYSEMLSEDYADKLDQPGKDKLATLSRLSQRMSELLDSLLEYSRVGRAEFSNDDVDLNRVVSQALELLQLRIEEGHISIRIARPLPTVKGDRIRLVEVFMNLISNAIKYNDKPKKDIEIGFESSPLGGQPVFYVRDNGIGIQEEHYEQIFQIFRRLHAANEYGGGSGAGLTIVRKIVERIGGRIWLKSIVGQGTTFYFTLGKDALTGRTK